MLIAPRILFRIAGDKWKQKISGEMTKPNQSRQKLNGIEGESISESGKKSSNDTGQHVQDRHVLVGNGTVDVFVRIILVQQRHL